MTNTIAIEAEQSTSEHPALGVIEHIDPHSLVLDTNVRDEAALGVRFVASIKEHGVLTPIAAVRDRDGQLRVRSGQRRTLAAREAGLASVPVYVRTATAGEDDKAELVERVSEQIVENDQRAQLHQRAFLTTRWIFVTGPRCSVPGARIGAWPVSIQRSTFMTPWATPATSWSSGLTQSVTWRRMA